MIRRTVRRVAAVTGGVAIGVLACSSVAVGLVDRRPPERFAHAAWFESLSVAMFGAILLLAIAVLIRRVTLTAPTQRAQRVSFLLRTSVDFADVEFSLIFTAALYGAIAFTGGSHSPLVPLIFGWVAFSVSLMSRPGLIAALGAVALCECGLVIRGGTSSDELVAAAVRGLFIAGAAVSHALLLRGLVARYRRRRARRLDEELNAVRAAARDYRLVTSALGPGSRGERSRAEEESLLIAGSVGAVADHAHWLLATVKRSLEADTCALLWTDDDGARLRLREVVSDCDDIRDPRWLDAVGVVGAVVRDRTPLLIAAVKPGQLPYYDGGHAGASVVAVPLLDQGHLRGVLCADRPRPFTAAESELLQHAAEQMLRTIALEQTFRAVERAKYEHERFFAAASVLGKALTPEQVMDTAFEAATAIADFDVAIIALYQKDKQRHKVAAVRVRSGGEGMVDSAQLTDLEFRDNAGLAAMVVKNRHYLPAGGEPRELSAPVYTRKVRMDEAKSLLVLPLLAADEPIGTMTLLAREEKRFVKDVREMLSVIGNQVAIALQNGILYRQMETMATTDGLTGLTNHRAFQERFGELLERARRHGHRAAVLLCDVDHFKKVNDTHGHPVGDEVLRRVAKVLQDVARKIDITARYGGEEFAVVLDGADAQQARAVAERVRVEIGKIVVETEKGPLSVTESIGVAAFPEDGDDRALLIERADLALYHAKHTGRNRVVTFQEFAAARAGGGSRKAS